MRYVVTGGCGFIGAHVVNLLQSKGKKVAIVDKITNRKTIDSAFLNEGAQHFYMDISDPQLMEKALLPDDVVIHLAAQSHVDVSFKNPVSTTISNVVGIHSLLDAGGKQAVNANNIGNGCRNRVFEGHINMRLGGKMNHHIIRQ